MKRLLKYIIFSLLTVVSVNDVLACWAPWELPVDYYMYRVDEVEFYKQSERDQEFNLSAMENCREWQRITSADISEQDIYQVVYKMSLKELESLRGKWWVWSDNKFEKWIHKDTEILDFLILAKNNEAIRSQIHSKWYYPTMKIGGASIPIEEVAERVSEIVDCTVEATVNAIQEALEKYVEKKEGEGEEVFYGLHEFQVIDD